MNQDLQLKLQAYLDGELPERETQVITDLLTRDSAARDLFAELTNTRSALQASEPDIKLPESGDFYWSKIRRQITNEERSTPVEKSISFAERLRRLLAPAATVAAVLLGVMIVQQQFTGGAYGAMEDGDHEDAEAFTYRDYESGTTLVWLSYPAENEIADSDTDDTLELN
jgi:anti-sigma factor RsiW